MRIKSAAEIELIRESGRWCSYAHRLLQERTSVGRTEAEVSLEVQQEATLAMLRAGDYGQLGSADGVKAGWRGQIGRRSSWAHAIAHDIEFAAGDLLVTETGAPVWGYKAELERGLVIGEPSDKVKWMFEHVVASQQVGFDAFADAKTCADVDRAVMRYFEQHDLLPYWRQHTGHGTGLRDHEAPFLDVGDETPLEPGMVFTIEPGIYDSAIGGLRHSDTVVVTDGGIEILTDYPRDLESLTIPAA
jgi:Xaa-Pro aminopeptidase